MGRLENLTPTLQKPSPQGFLVLLSSPGRQVRERNPTLWVQGWRWEVALSGPGCIRAAAQMKSIGHAMCLVYRITTAGLAEGPGVRHFKHHAEHCITTMIIDPSLNVSITWAHPLAFT